MLHSHKQKQILDVFTATFLTSSVEKVPISELWFILINLADLQLARDSRGEASVNVEIYSAIYHSCGMKKADKLAALKYADLKMCVLCRCSRIQPC